MNRNVRYKAWDKRHEEIFRVAKIIFDNYAAEEVHYDTSKYGNDFFTAELPPFGLLSNGEVILLEDTGLKDKDASRIFEGDIVNVYVGDTEGGHDSLGQYNGPERIEYQRLVEWIDCGLSWKGSGCTLCDKNSRHFQVIGNKYKNPEMLEGISND